MHFEKDHGVIQGARVAGFYVLASGSMAPVKFDYELRYQPENISGAGLASGSMLYRGWKIH